LSSGGVGKEVVLICGLAFRLAVASGFYLNMFSAFHISLEDRGRSSLQNVVNIECVQNFSHDIDYVISSESVKAETGDFKTSVLWD
jgi:hypothetical protein